MCSFCNEISFGQTKYVSYSFKKGLWYKESESACPPVECPIECDETRIWLSNEGDAILLVVENSNAGTVLDFEISRCPFCGRDLTKDLIC